MSTIVVELAKEQTKALIRTYQAYQAPHKSQWISHLFRLKGATISVYLSGKVLFQGKDAQTYAQQWISPPKKETNNQPVAIIGSDEVGNGSYFGGLAVVASFVTADQHPFLQELGVGDSKKLTDQKIKQLAPILRKTILHQPLLVQPDTYNQVIEQQHNAVSIKVALHNQAIYLLLNKGVRPKKIIVDGFTTYTNYMRYLAKEKNQINLPITLIEKAESQCLAVAVSSILARDLFLTNLEELSQTIGLPLPSGAGEKSDQVAATILSRYGREQLKTVAKMHFKTTQKAEKLVRKETT